MCISVQVKENMGSKNPIFLQNDRPIPIPLPERPVVAEALENERSARAALRIRRDDGFPPGVTGV